MQHVADYTPDDRRGNDGVRLFLKCSGVNGSHQRGPVERVEAVALLRHAESTVARIGHGAVVAGVRGILPGADREVVKALAAQSGSVEIPADKGQDAFYAGIGVIELIVEVVHVRAGGPRSRLHGVGELREVAGSDRHQGANGSKGRYAVPISHLDDRVQQISL